MVAVAQRRFGVCAVEGRSDPARALVADKADVRFINGQPKENVASLIADVAARPRTGAPVRCGLSAFVVARETDADPKAVMFQTFAKYPRIGTDGGTAAGLVGSYDTVAQRIREWADLGIETFMRQFQPSKRRC